jgi:hypothetical protein
VNRIVESSLPIDQGDAQTVTTEQLGALQTSKTSSDNHYVVSFHNAQSR